MAIDDVIDDPLFLLSRATALASRRSTSFSTAVLQVTKGHPTAAAKDRARRRQQFPSVAQRVVTYMGSWSERLRLGKKVNVSLEGVAASPTADKPFLLTAQHVAAQCTPCKPCCKRQVRCKPCSANALAHYCTTEAVGQLVVGGPKVVSFGDLDINEAGLPIFAKASRLDQPVTPILWSLNEGRHYGWTQKLPLPETPWAAKQEVALFRGAPTGRERQGLGSTRHRFLARHANHTGGGMVDLGFTQAWFKDEVRFVKKRLRVAQQLRYKYLIALEGNDVASGLKWMLFSDSVVLMPAVKVATWALEGTLQPFVHYIPLKPDGSDLLQMVRIRRWLRR